MGNISATSNQVSTIIIHIPIRTIKTESMTEICTFKCNLSSSQINRIQNANRNISWIFQRHQAANVNSEPPP